MKQKKLMLLGGIRYLLPVIDAAHKQGYYVITADYLPDNIAHRYSDEYVNVRIVDKEAVLKVACEKEMVLCRLVLILELWRLLMCRTKCLFLLLVRTNL